MPLSGYIALYGGSFNPPHMGHQMACVYLLEALGADGVWLVPSWSHPFGKTLAEFSQRIAMCERLARPLGDRVQVSSVEQELGGAGHTYDTIAHLQNTHPELHFSLAVGADIISESGQWHRWNDIEAMVPIIVIGRSGYEAQGYDDNISTLELPRVSSTEVRKRLSENKSVKGLVPLSVARYVEEHHLYGFGGENDG